MRGRVPTGHLHLTSTPRPGNRWGPHGPGRGWGAGTAPAVSREGDPVRTTLSLRRETLTELTTDELVDVVGGAAGAAGSCFAASCITGGSVTIKTTLTNNLTAIDVIVE